MEEKEKLTMQAADYYEACLLAPDFKAGLSAAELNLAQASLEIETTYTYQVEVAKQSIQYNQRMDYFNQGEKGVISFYNHELHKLLAAFLVYYTPCPGYLDLRNL